jgi:hypothetical protein
VDDVTRSVASVRPLTILPLKLALKELASAADGAERIASDDVSGGIRSIDVSTTGPSLFRKRFGNTFVYWIRSLGSIYKLTGSADNKKGGAVGRLTN